MFTKCRILFPTDFSHYALRALRYAIALAKQFDGHVQLVHVLDTDQFRSGDKHGIALTDLDLSALYDSMQDHAEERMVSLIENLEENGVKAVSTIVRGNPMAVLPEIATQKHCDLVVIATHGRTGFEHAVFGSTAERVVRCATVPVLSVKHPEHEFVSDPEFQIRIDKVLFPTDFSEFSDKALAYAASLCREFRAKLLIQHACELPVVLPEMLPENTNSLGENLADHARQILNDLGAGLGDVKHEVVVNTGLAFREICKTVEREDVDLVVMPTHGRAGLSHFLFGSVAEKVVRMAKCPVMTIRPIVPVSEETDAPEGEYTAPINAPA
jgi:nucleotide-binding universal stress UspA family protein